MSKILTHTVEYTFSREMLDVDNSLKILENEYTSIGSQPKLSPTRLLNAIMRESKVDDFS